ncbi:MAG TPA: hypothetical protein VN368_00640 [Candidatus Methylomirabilis sp.]|nr:hypothetical protein [Candidatus Methylomirabilis sp.]
MKYVKAVFLIMIILLFTGCIEQIVSRFQKVDVIYVNLSVITEENKTLITDMKATRGEVTKINAPGFVAPDKFPGIYVKIKQSINTSKPELVKDVSVPNGIPYIGPGNYSFTVQLFENEYNKTLPIFVYSEIIDNKSMRLARNIFGFNSTMVTNS